MLCKDRHKQENSYPIEHSWNFAEKKVITALYCHFGTLLFALYVTYDVECKLFFN